MRKKWVAPWVSVGAPHRNLTTYAVRLAFPVPTNKSAGCIDLSACLPAPNRFSCVRILA